MVELNKISRCVKSSTFGTYSIEREQILNTNNSTQTQYAYFSRVNITDFCKSKCNITNKSPHSGRCVLHYLTERTSTSKSHSMHV